jgi:hypothetical protein
LSGVASVFHGCVGTTVKCVSAVSPGTWVSRWFQQVGRSSPISSGATRHISNIRLAYL